MLKKKLFLGMLIGITPPAVLIGVIYFWLNFKGLKGSDSFYESVSLLIIAANGLIVKYVLTKNSQDYMVRGVFIVTFIMLIAWVIKYQL